MADLIQCPKCGLRQTARHAYCSRCEYAFTGSPDEYLRDDRSNPTGTPSTTPTPHTDSHPPGGAYGEASFEGSVRRGGGFSEREAPRTDSVRAVKDGDRLVRDRGSLSRRLSTPASAVPMAEQREGELPDAPSWTMPVRQSAVFRMPDGALGPLPDEDPTEEQPSVRPPIEPEPSGRDFLVRGRPQGELYASERSLPPEDPLLADLVAGRVSKNPRFTDEFALPEDWDQPPVRKSHPGRSHPGRSHPGRSRPDRSPLGRQVPESEPSHPMPDRPDVRVTQSGRRIVPPSTSERRRSRSGVRTTLSGLTDGGTNPGARPRTNPGVRLPTDPGSGSPSRKPARSSIRSLTNPGSRVPMASVPSEYDFMGVQGADLRATDEVRDSARPDAAMPSVPPAGGTGARAPGVRRTVARTNPIGEATPPPPRRKLTGTEIGGFIAAAILAVITLIALSNGLGVFKAKKAIVRTLENGIGPDGPTADLPNLLDATLGKLDLGSQIQATHRSISAATDTYTIGVEVKTPVAGYPLRWKAVRQGPYDVDARLVSLGVFDTAGWSLDAEAESALSDYQTARQEKLRKERDDAVEKQRKLIAGEDEVKPPEPEPAPDGDGDAPDGDPTPSP